MTPDASYSEMLVLQALVEKGSATAAELSEALAPGTGWAYSTVVTFLRRLESKGLIGHARRPGRKAFVYRPTRRAAGSRRRALRDLLQRVFGGDPLPLVSSLLEETHLKKSQIEQLRRMLDEHARSGGGPS